jgi:hypothetical protein
LPSLVRVVPHWMDEKNNLHFQKTELPENYINIQTANLNIRINQTGTAIIFHQNLDVDKHFLHASHLLQ